MSITVLHIRHGEMAQLNHQNNVIGPQDDLVILEEYVGVAQAFGLIFLEAQLQFCICRYIIVCLILITTAKIRV